MSCSCKGVVKQGEKEGERKRVKEKERERERQSELGVEKDEEKKSHAYVRTRTRAPTNTTGGRKAAGQEGLERLGVRDIEPAPPSPVPRRERSIPL